MRTYHQLAKVLLGVVAVLISVGTALAGDQNDGVARGGQVLPAVPIVLQIAAELTAVYNTGLSVGLTPPPPDVPFHVLVSDATVDRGTILYVPIFFADDSGGTPAGFPRNVYDLRADEDYLLGYVLANYGVTAFVVQVDGVTTVLGSDYIVGTKTPPLLDGTPPGTNYITCATFLTPLTPGTHTVGIGGIIGGAPVVFDSYTVTVK
jgi:hypothetical protein